MFRDVRMNAIWCDSALLDGVVARHVRLAVDDSGVIGSVMSGSPAQSGDLELSTVMPGFGNSHSHAFHRVLRGRTHGDGGDFWSWRTRMYAAATALDPDLYRRLAIGVFEEMLSAGYTAVGEFHYVHHQPDGSPYPQTNAMELALVDAAITAGIRLTLLDTLYLSGGVDESLSLQQRRFGDGDAARWLERWHALRDAVDGLSPLIGIGAAVHSVRAVSPGELRAVAAGIPAEVPVHVHVSEQPQENEDAVRRYGSTPTRLLADAGLLSPRTSVVHATHLTDDDISLIGSAGATVVMCPTTEADLGDGIGPARRLADAGARIAIGSDQNAVVDPFLELRGLEAGERLASGERGRFSPTALLTAGGADGYRSLGLRGGVSVGSVADLVEIDTISVRTAGSQLDQLVLAATATDVTRVIVGGRVVSLDPADIGTRLARAIAAVDARTGAR